MNRSLILENASLEDIRAIVREELKILKPEPDDKIISRRDAARKLGICLPTLDKAIDEGKLKAFRLNNRVLLKTSDIEAGLKRKAPRSK